MAGEGVAGEAGGKLLMPAGLSSIAISPVSCRVPEGLAMGGRVYQTLLSESLTDIQADMPTMFWRLSALRSPGAFEVCDWVSESVHINFKAQKQRLTTLVEG